MRNNIIKYLIVILMPFLQGCMGLYYQGHLAPEGSTFDETIKNKKFDHINDYIAYLDRDKTIQFVSGSISERTDLFWTPIPLLLYVEYGMRDYDMYLTFVNNSNCPIEIDVKNIYCTGLDKEWHSEVKLKNYKIVVSSNSSEIEIGEIKFPNSKKNTKSIEFGLECNIIKHDATESCFKRFKYTRCSRRFYFLAVLE